MKRLSNSLTLLMLSLLLVSVSGCSLLTEPKRHLKLDIHIAGVVNLGDKMLPTATNMPVAKVSHPISLRLYQLSDDDRFNQLDFMDLYQKDRVLLADSLVRSKSLGIFLPGQTQQLGFLLNPATQYIAVFAAFSDYRLGQFKDIIPVSKLNEYNLSLIAAQNNVFLQTPVIKEN